MASFLKKASDFLNNAFPTPDYLSLNPSGIDIAPDAIYFMRLKKNKHGVIPEKYEKVPFGKNINLNNKDLSPEDRLIIVNSLKKLKKKYNLEYIIASLPEHETYIFKTIMPKQAKMDIVSFIRYKIEENVPLPAIDVNFYYLVTPELNKEGDIGVVVSVFPKTIVNTYTDVYEEAGLFPVSFFAESRALFYSIVKEGDTNPYMLIQLLSDRVSAAVLEDGIVQYTTDIQIDTSKLSGAFAGPEATLLKEELNKILIYWFTSKKDFSQHKKIENVLLVGPKAAEPEVIDFLERALKINVETANVWVNCFDAKEYVSQIDQKSALEYSVVIGLAIRCINYA